MTADRGPGPGPGSTGRRETADVDAFVRLAVDSVHRLVADEQLAAELADAAAADLDDPMERLLAAQHVLARVLAYERATLGPPLTIDEVEDWLRRPGLEVEDAVRLLYELSLDGGRSWPAVQFAGEAAMVPVDPWLRALWLLLQPEAGAAEGRAVRTALARSRSRPLGFAGLVLELADAAPPTGAAGVASPLERVAAVLDDDAFLRREGPDVSVDLRARCTVYRADAARRRGQLDVGAAHLASAEALLDTGAGHPVLRSLVEEAGAGLDLARGDREGALRRFSAAVERLGGFESKEARHRLVEIGLKRALMLAGDASSRHEAAEALAALAGSVADASETQGDIDPALRLRVVLACARVELDLARQSVAERDPLGSGGTDPVKSSPGETLPEDALESYAQSWSDQSSRLVRASEWLRKGEFWLAADDERSRAEHLWLSGLSSLLTDRGASAKALRRSLSRFQALGDEVSVEQISIDLIVCGVLAGALGDDAVDHGSEPLELFRKLAAARTKSS